MNANSLPLGTRLFGDSDQLHGDILLAAAQLQHVAGMNDQNGSRVDVV